MKIAVIGAGIFGISSAMKLREKFSKAEITIFEKGTSILSSASGINQYRLHRGYHYPRSNETVEQVLSGVLEWEREFKTSIVKGERYYGISKFGSSTSKESYLDFLERNNLKFEIVNPENLPVRGENLDLLVKVEENSFDVGKLYLDLTKRLRSNKIKVLTGTKFSKVQLKDFDLVINATYSNINDLLDENEQMDFQFELCEKAIVSLGPEYKNRGIVIMDGEFCCIDPLGSNPYFHVIGHVKEAVLDRQIGKKFIFKDNFQNYVNSGPMKINETNFKNILESCKTFFIFVNNPVFPLTNKGSNSLYCPGIFYKGSMFTIRTVLPNRDHDDARPSSIIKHNSQFYSIFGGKIGTSLNIANQLKEMI